LGTNDSQKRILKELGGGPNPRVANPERWYAGLFQFVANCEEFVEGDVITDFDTVLVQELLVVPENVAMVYARQYCVCLPVLGHHIHQRLWKGLIPAITLIKFGDWFAIPRIDVLAKQLPTRVTLPSIRRVVDGQPGLQDRSSTRAASACDGGIDYTDARILVPVGVKKRVKRCRLAAGGPPGKHL
jgi:hypothetical protein